MKYLSVRDKNYGASTKIKAIPSLSLWESLIQVFYLLPESTRKIDILWFLKILNLGLNNPHHYGRVLRSETINLYEIETSSNITGNSCYCDRHLSSFLSKESTLSLCFLMGVSDSEAKRFCIPLKKENWKS